MPICSHMASKNAPKSSLGGVLGPLGAILGALGLVWRYLEVSWRYLGASWTYFWRRLGASWAVWACRRRSPGVAGGRRGRIRRDPSLGFFRIFLGCYYVNHSYILRKRRFGRIREGKEDEKKVRVWDFIRHAQAQGLARQIQSAAELLIRHRACALTELKKNNSEQAV